MKSLFLFCAVFAVLVAEGEDAPLLRLGILSDTHINPKRETPATFEKALRWLKGKGVDAVTISGDLVDDGTPEQFELFNAIWGKVFPASDHVERICIMAWHDDHDYQFKDKWERFFGTPYQEVFRKDVKGFTFVCANDVNARTNGHALMAHVIAEQGKEKPVFYLQHPHPASTCYWVPEWGDDGITTRAFAGYPNAIVFSGHSHFPQTSERSIWQGTFTSVNCGSAYYTELEKGHIGGTLPPDREKVRTGMYARVYKDRIVFERWSFYYDEPAGEDWVVPLPVKHGLMPYTVEAIKARAVKPCFAPNAKVSVKAGDAKTVNVSFPAAAVASETDMVHDYRITAFDPETGNTLDTQLLFSEFYLGRNHMRESYTAPFATAKLQAPLKCRFEVRALSDFGAESDAISTDTPKP